MSQFKLKSFSLVLSVLILGGFYSYGLWAWTGPTSAPPGSNASSPVNIGTSDQEKAGRLSATEFYDADDTDFYVNPSGDSKISGTLSLGGDLYDITNSKKVYDSVTGKFDPAAMPYEKGDLTSDWATSSYADGYYDTVVAGDVKDGVSFGRSYSGTLLPPDGTATTGDVTSGKTYYDGSWTPKTGTYHINLPSCSSLGYSCQGIGGDVCFCDDSKCVNISSEGGDALVGWAGSGTHFGGSGYGFSAGAGGQVGMSFFASQAWRQFWARVCYLL